jgi:hypothetical protein
MAIIRWSTTAPRQGSALGTPSCAPPTDTASRRARAVGVLGPAGGPGQLAASCASSTQCVECMSAGWVATRPDGRDDVGARQRPNTGANQRGRASVSSSAGNCGAPERLGNLRKTSEALLDSDDRTRYQHRGDWRPKWGVLGPPLAVGCAHDRRRPDPGYREREGTSSRGAIR